MRAVSVAGVICLLFSPSVHAVNASQSEVAPLKTIQSLYERRNKAFSEFDYCPYGFQGSTEENDYPALKFKICTNADTKETLTISSQENRIAKIEYSVVRAKDKCDPAAMQSLFGIPAADFQTNTEFKTVYLDGKARKIIPSALDSDTAFLICSLADGGQKFRAEIGDPKFTFTVENIQSERAKRRIAAAQEETKAAEKDGKSATENNTLREDAPRTNGKCVDLAGGATIIARISDSLYEASVLASLFPHPVMVREPHVLIVSEKTAFKSSGLIAPYGQNQWGTYDLNKRRHFWVEIDKENPEYKELPTRDGFTKKFEVLRESPYCADRALASENQKKKKREKLRKELDD